MTLQIYIEGEEAAVQQLLTALPAARVQPHDTTRGVEWTGLIEIAGQLISAVGGAVSIGHTLWLWHKAHAKGRKTILQKLEDDRKSRLILDDTVTPEDIQKFLGQ